MKHTLCILAVLFANTILYSQITPTSQWEWINGDSTINEHGVYGTKGIAASANKPGGRVSATTYKDASGNIWIFGGNGTAGLGSTGIGLLNDLWKYNPASSQWTWVSGDSTFITCATYGTKGIPSINNIPGGKANALVWTDAEGNFWFFGGDHRCLSSPSPYSHELWKYNPTTNAWAWINGDDTELYPLGVYGEQGVSSSSNWPGARSSSAGWQDSDGNFWMYGGHGYGRSIPGRIGTLSDLWKFSPSTGQWIWVNGNRDENIPGLYGIKGVGTAATNPGVRENTSAWIDHNNNLWLFGGIYIAFDGPHYFNDIWKYDRTINQWAWMNGDSTSNGNSVYGEPGVLSVLNQPSGRGNCYSSSDNVGNLLVWGGGDINAGYLAELWTYNLASNQWAWIRDTLINQAGIYGTKDMPSPGNVPGSRIGGASWTDASGNFYIFGGSGFATDGGGYLNEMWKLVPGNVLAVQMINSTANAVDEKIAVQWQTAQENNSDYFIIEHSRNGVDFTAYGKVPAAGNSSSLKAYSFTDDYPFEGINFYRIKMVNAGGTFSNSRIVSAKKTGTIMLQVFPNPAKDFLLVRVNKKIKDGILQLISADGRIVKEDKLVSAANTLMSIDIKNLSGGIYLILLKSNKGNAQQKFIKQ